MTSSIGPSFLLLARDERGAPYAIEVVEAEEWEPTIEEPPKRERADVRVVRLGGTAPPASALPRWLAVEAGGGRQRPPPPPAARTERPRHDTTRDLGAQRVAEAAAAYEVRPATAPDAADDATAVGGDRGDAGELAIAERLWPWSPWHTEPGASLAEFLAAGAAALRHPGPLPAEPARQIEALARFARGRPALAPLELLRADALERWLLRRFSDPDAFAEAILLARIEEAGDAQAATLLHFLRNAEVPEGTPRYAELALDRRVLREQASPWLHPHTRSASRETATHDAERAVFAAALRAVHAWRERYLAAYAAHYRTVVERADALRSELRPVAARASALMRLQQIRSLASEEASRALRRYAAAVHDLDALPDAPAPGEPTTASVPLGAEPSTFAAASEAAGAVDAALEDCRRTLAAALAGLALDRVGVPGLDRLLQAIAASELDALDRVLDERLAAHLEALLDRPPEPLLTRLARLHPTVTVATRDAVVADFARLLEQGIAASPSASVVLAEGALVAAPLS